MVGLGIWTRSGGRWTPEALRRDPVVCDPFWDDGLGARKTHRRLRIEGLIALALAIAACGLTAALWLRTLAPYAHGLGLG